jgi:hypothetical protein
MCHATLQRQNPEISGGLFSQVLIRVKETIFVSELETRRHDIPTRYIPTELEE